ncbi:MAG: hypothetical protein KJ949_00790 [Nanoarchaeota archaeon]|nr:hypothetical protein [Nanoarchaeota archaeon]
MRKEVLILFLFLIPFVSADIISLNSGGTGNIILNPNEYLEGFFWGEPIVASYCGDGTCDVGEDCSSCVADCGVCPSETITSTGGGGVSTTIAVSILEVSPEIINLNLAINTNIEQIIQVKNLGTSSVNVSVTESGLGNMVIINEKTFLLAAGETKNLNVVFVAFGQTGIFTGTLNIGGEIVSVALNIKTKLLLFDSVIEVLNENAQVKQGTKLKTKITLIPMGDPDRLDVTLNYTIKDYNGTLYFTKTETMLIEEKMSFERSFSTGKIPGGKYIIGLLLTYPNGVAPASAHFEIISTLFGKIILTLIVLILIVFILLIIYLIWKRRKDEEEQDVS